MTETPTTTQALTDAFAPVLTWLFIIGGLGIGIALAVQLVVWGWYLVRDMIGPADGGSWIDQGTRR